MDPIKTANEEVQKAAEVGAAAVTAKILSRDDILKVDDTKRELVNVPEWGGSVWVYGMSAKERDAFEETMLEGKGKNMKRNLANLRARLCARCICDDKGQRIFKGEFVAALGEKSAKAVERIFPVAQRLSGMTDEDVEDMVKN